MPQFELGRLTQQQFDAIRDSFRQPGVSSSDEWQQMMQWIYTQFTNDPSDPGFGMFQPNQWSQMVHQNIPGTFLHGFFMPADSTPGGPPDPSPDDPPAQTPGLPAHPLPEPDLGGGNSMTTLSGLGRIWPAILAAWSAAEANNASSQTSFNPLVPGAGLLYSIKNLFGMGQADNFADRFGISESQGALLESFLSAIGEMEAAGLVHAWTAVHRRGMNAGQQIKPRYFILDMENAQGFYSTFHMSRSGLKRHDEKQDTIKRPRTARRRRN